MVSFVFVVGSYRYNIAYYLSKIENMVFMGSFAGSFDPLRGPLRGTSSGDLLGHLLPSDFAQVLTYILYDSLWQMCFVHDNSLGHIGILLSIIYRLLRTLLL